MTITIKTLHPNARITPQASSSHLTLFACLDHPILLHPGMRRLIPTGISLQLSRDLAAQLCPNRNLAIQHGVTILDAPQLITADDHAEIQVLLINLGNKGFSIKPDMAIAKLMAMPIYKPEIIWHEPTAPFTSQLQEPTTPPQTYSQAMPVEALI